MPQHDDSPDTLYYTRCPAPTATGLATGLGTLGPALRGFNVRLQALQDVEDPALRVHHFDHGIVNLIREGGNVPPLWAASSGVPTRLIGITWLDEYQAVVTTPGSAVRSLADLRGRRVAIPVSSGSVVDFLRAQALRGFERALAGVELTLDDIVLVDALVPGAASGPASDRGGESFLAELALLVSGAVDAVWLKGAGGVAGVRRHGLVELMRIDLAEDPLVRVNAGTPRAITARQELIDQRPDLVGAYLEVLRGSYGAVGGERTRLWEVLADETHQGVAEAEVAYGAVEADSLVPSLDPLRVQALQSQADFLAEQGFIPNRLDVGAWSLDVGAVEPALAR